MDKARMIEKLNEILRWEWAGMIQYTQFSFVITDVWREVYSEVFRKSGKEALSHAHVVGDLIVNLGGVPTVERGEVRQATTLNEMLEHSLWIEQKHVDLYTEALTLCGDQDVGLRVILEDICRDEQEGAWHMQKLLAKKEFVASKPASSTKVG
jgi:bacterioferritin